MFGKECLEEGKYTYLYKSEVEIPPMSMVDDDSKLPWSILFFSANQALKSYCLVLKVQ